MRPSCPPKEKGVKDIYELEVIYAPDVKPEWNGKLFLFHAGWRVLGADKQRYRIVQLFYYNACPIRYISVIGRYSGQQITIPEDVWVEIVDWTQAPVRLHIKKKAEYETIMTQQHKLGMTIYNRHEYVFLAYPSIYKSKAKRVPILDFEMIEHNTEFPPISCTDAPDNIALIREDNPWFKYKTLARRLKYDIIPALGRAPTEAEYRKLFREVLRIKGAGRQDRLLQERHRVGLP